MACQQAEATSRKYAEVNEQLLATNQHHRAQLQALQEQLRQQQQRWEDNERRGNVWSVLIVSLRRETERLRAQIESAPQLSAQRAAELETLRAEWARLQESFVLFWFGFFFCALSLTLSVSLSLFLSLSLSLSLSLTLSLFLSLFLSLSLSLSHSLSLSFSHTLSLSDIVTHAYIYAYI